MNDNAGDEERYLDRQEFWKRWLKRQETLRDSKTVTDEAITALARHYGTPEAQVREELADMADAGFRSRDLLENAAMSLIVALDKLTGYGFDDAAVTAAEQIEDL